MDVFLSGEYSGLNVQLTTHLQVQSFRISGVIPVLTCMPSWSGQGERYLF